ncbi:glycosyltransferase family 39 protein [bacterium]|nr:glycosyltransferase family 39 protein [bacterium]
MSSIDHSGNRIHHCGTNNGSRSDRGFTELERNAGLIRMEGTPDQSMSLLRRYQNDLVALAVIAIVFGLMCAISWQKWASASIDGGAAMNVPLRLLNGESLYSQVYFLYGPLGPYLNALLFKIFGVHLSVLYVAGIVSSFLLVLFTYLLGKQFMGTMEATLAALAVEALCIFKHGAHSIFPYTFSALYGTLLGIAALGLQIRYTASQKSAHLLLSGILGGLALICKQEFGFAILASTFALSISARPGQRIGVLVYALLPALAIPVFTYITLALRMPYSVLFKDTFFLPHHIPWEQIYYNSMRTGMNDIGKTMMEFAGATMIVSSFAALIGLISVCFSRPAGQEQVAIRRRWIRWLSLLGGGSSTLLLVILFILGTVVYVSPLRALPLLCGLLLYGYLRRDKDWRSQAVPRSIFLLSVYSLAVLARVITRVPSGGAYGLLQPVPLLAFVYSVAAAYPRPFQDFLERRTTRG